MAIENGEVLKGKVTGITKFGAFVELEGGKTGMVHISEVASAFVKEISEFVSVGQEVVVKVIKISPDGKIALSMKQAASANEKPKDEKTVDFDDMLSKFMQTSNEKINDLNRYNGERRTSRRGGRN